jgi:hypothetical protein
LQQAHSKHKESEARVHELEAQLQSVNEQLEAATLKASASALELDNFKRTLADRDDSHSGVCLCSNCNCGPFALSPLFLRHRDCYPRRCLPIDMSVPFLSRLACAMQISMLAELLLAQAKRVHSAYPSA